MRRAASLQECQEENMDNFNFRKREVICIRNDDLGMYSQGNGHLLEIGRRYTVEKVEPQSYHTWVILQEFPSQRFNSVWFEEIDKK